MYDFSKQITRFHDHHVRLTRDQQNDMKSRREANVKRLKDGLDDLDKPAIVETIQQGGYKQKTMTQPPEADPDSRYDIDLGVVFEEKDAKGPRTTKGWVRDAIARKSKGVMKNEPEAKPKCVRVIYADGYQCDFPVFRRRWTGVGWKYELAAGDEWVASDPEAMNRWIELQVSAKSPEEVGSYQLRREVRLGKFYCKTHAHRRRAKFPGGLVATAIIMEYYVPYPGRDDKAFREMLRMISHRSADAPVYANGVQVSDERDRDRIQRLIDAAKESVAELDTIAEDASEEEAAKAWKKVFRHNFFDELAEEARKAADNRENKSALGRAAAASPYVVAKPAAASMSDAERLERMRTGLYERQTSSTGAPWAR